MAESLRTGLVEAMMETYAKRIQRGMAPHPYTRVYMSDMSAVLDSMLGFLTDNAEAWGGAGNAWAVKLHDGWRSEDVIGYNRGHSDRHARALIAALSDSRDTGDILDNADHAD